MFIIFSIELTICFLFSILFYFRYAKKSIPLYLDGLIILTWVINFAFVALIPLDIFVCYAKKDEKDYENVYETLKILWRVLYCIMMIMNLLVIPIAQEYEKAADFEPKLKIKRALKIYFLMMLVGLIALILFVIYLIFIKKSFMASNISGFLISLSNAWGIILILLLLSYGLVTIPKQLWKSSDYVKRTHYLEWSAQEINSTIDDKELDLIEYASKIKYACKTLKAYDPNYVIANRIFEDLKDVRILESRLEDEEIKTYDYSYENLIKISGNTQDTLHDIERLKSKLERIFKEWVYLDKLTTSQNDINHDNSFSSGSSTWNKIKNKYYIHIRPLVLKGLSIFFSLMSLVVVYGEFTIGIKMEKNIFDFVLNLKENDYFAFNLVLVLFLIMLFYYCLVSLFHLRLSGYYSISSKNQTDAYSLFHLTLFICRVSFPLCLNFLSFFKKPICTALEEINGGIEKIPIFEDSFPMFYPGLLIIFILFNLFNVYNKIMNWLGVPTYGFKSEYNDEKVREGQEILKKRKKEFYSINLKVLDTKEMDRTLIKNDFLETNGSMIKLKRGRINDD